MRPLLSINQKALYYQIQIPAVTLRPDTPSAIPGGTVQPGKNGNPENSQKVPSRRSFDTYECQTCKNRKYQDGSDDPGVSFKTPTHISPENAAYAIRSHEMEHVSHAQAKAQREDEKILSQSVTYHTAICPECGRTYLSGGTTRTVFQKSQDFYNKAPEQKGAFLDITA